MVMWCSVCYIHGKTWFMKWYKRYPGLNFVEFKGWYKNQLRMLLPEKPGTNRFVAWQLLTVHIILHMTNSRIVLVLTNSTSVVFIYYSYLYCLAELISVVMWGSHGDSVCSMHERLCNWSHLCVYTCVCHKISAIWCLASQIIFRKVLMLLFFCT